MTIAELRWSVRCLINRAIINQSPYKENYIDYDDLMDTLDELIRKAEESE